MIKPTLLALLVDGRAVAALEVADGFVARARGLLGRRGFAGAMWFPGVRQVHTVGMRFALDVAHVDATGRVIAVSRLPPHRLGRYQHRSAGVLEAAAGSFDRWGVRVGAHLDRGGVTGVGS